MDKLTPAYGYVTDESSPYNLAMSEASWLIDGLYAYGETSESFAYDNQVTFGVGFAAAESVSKFIFYFHYVGYEFTNPTSTCTGWFSFYVPSETKVFTSPDNTEDSWTEVDSFTWAADNDDPWLPVEHVSIDANVGGEIQKTGKFTLTLSAPTSAKYFKIKCLHDSTGNPATIVDSVSGTSNVNAIYELEAYSADFEGNFASFTIDSAISGTGVHTGSGNVVVDIDTEILGSGLVGVIGNGTNVIYQSFVFGYGGGYGSVTVDTTYSGSGSSDFYGNEVCEIITLVDGSGFTGVVGQGEIEFDVTIYGTLYFSVSGSGSIECTVSKVYGTGKDTQRDVGILRFDDRWLFVSDGHGDIKLDLAMNGE
jgi:hypothetical protein